VVQLVGSDKSFAFFPRSIDSVCRLTKVLLLRLQTTLRRRYSRTQHKLRRRTPSHVISQNRTWHLVLLPQLFVLQDVISPAPRFNPALGFDFRASLPLQTEPT